VCATACSALRHRIGGVEHEEELYAERERRKVYAELLAAGALELTDELDQDARIKLYKAWDDVTRHMAFKNAYYALEQYIADRTLGSIAVQVDPSSMEPGGSIGNSQLLSLIEAEHEALRWLADNPHLGSPNYPGPNQQWMAIITDAPEAFRRRANAILEPHLVNLRLNENSRLVPLQSQEMHNQVVEPTLHLLHGQPRFADAEKAYQDALRELRDHRPDDAITDAAGALEQALRAAGCTGNSLGELRKSGQQAGVLKADDDRITGVIGQTIEWIKDKRNAGEAHGSNAKYLQSDAWMLVHIVGALILRISDAAGK
jgi:hypothetical protein